MIFLKSYKAILQKRIDEIMNNVYPNLAKPFNDLNDIPNNWLKRNGYAMRKKEKER